MSTLPDYILNVLPGGKYHDIAVQLRDKGGVLQWSPLSEPDWWDDFRADKSPKPFGDSVNWRIKPETRRYRVASCFDGDHYFSLASSSEASARTTEGAPHFVRWLTDWVEYEV